VLNQPRAADALLRQSARANDNTTVTLPTLVPYLKAAQSTSRIIGDARHAERMEWQPVDMEMLALLQDHLSYLSGVSGTGAGIGDAWTEGEAVCELLRGLLPVIRTLR
jgi:hypothetical protein